MGLISQTQSVHAPNPSIFDAIYVRSQAVMGCYKNEKFQQICGYALLYAWQTVHLPNLSAHIIYVRGKYQKVFTKVLSLFLGCKKHEQDQPSPCNPYMRQIYPHTTYARGKYLRIFAKILRQLYGGKSINGTRPLHATYIYPHIVNVRGEIFLLRPFTRGENI